MGLKSAMHTRLHMLTCLVISMTAVGCGTTAKISLQSNGTAVYSDRKARLAEWSADDGEFVAIAEPVSLGGVAYEPYPRHEAFATVAARATLNGSRWSGRVVIKGARVESAFEIEHFSITAAHVNVRARNAQDVITLSIRGPQDNNPEDLTTRAARLTARDPAGATALEQWFCVNGTHTARVQRHTVSCPACTGFYGTCSGRFIR